MRTESASGHRPEIDGLRALAVISVVLYHFDFGVPGGHLGVDVFFVISGYVITRIIHAELQRGDFEIAGFYERRVRRIFPALFAMLSVTLAAGWFVLLPHDFITLLRESIGTTLFGSNLLFARAGYFHPASRLLPLLHMWSLAVEEQFYIVFPLILALGYRRFRKRLGSLSIAGAVVSLVAAAWFSLRGHESVFFLTPFRAWELLAGASLVLCAIPAIPKGVREAMGIGGLVAVGWSVFHFSSMSLFPFDAILATGGTMAVIASSGPGDTRAARWLSIGVVRYVGAISYSLYLWHWPLIVYARFLAGLHPGAALRAGALALSVAMAVLSFHLIEQPFRRRRIARSRRRMFAMGAAAIALTIAPCFVGIAERGFPHRFDARTIQLDAMRSPRIPFLECMHRLDQGCVIGDTSHEPTVLVWGDSHALTWAPALDALLKRKGEAAYLAVYPACPAFLGVHDQRRPKCYIRNEAIRAFIEGPHALKIVVLASFWSLYFGGDNTQLYGDGDRGGFGVAKDRLGIATTGLNSTLGFLRDHGVRTVLMGDVPGASESVPLAMALAQAHGGDGMRPLSLEEVRTRDRSFYSIAMAAERNGLATFVDTAPWFCGASCEYESDGMPLYFDQNHLNILGSMSRMSRLEQALAGVLDDGTAGADHDRPASKPISLEP